MRKIGSARVQSALTLVSGSLIRLAEGHAKMRFKNVVELDDVEEAKRLLREAIKQSATDPMSGKIDISILTTLDEWLPDSQETSRIDIRIEHLIETMQSERGEASQVHLVTSKCSIRQECVHFDGHQRLFDDALRSLQEEGNSSLCWHQINSTCFTQNNL